MDVNTQFHIASDVGGGGKRNQKLQAWDNRVTVWRQLLRTGPEVWLLLNTFKEWRHTCRKDVFRNLWEIRRGSLNFVR